MSLTPVTADPGTSSPADGDRLLARFAPAVADKYDGLREIGRGGMAVVYAGRDRRLHREVALKVLPPDLAYRADIKERFVREAQTAARLNHPNIVPIFAVEEADGLVYIAMALIDGESLAQRFARERRPTVPFVRSVLAQVADALAYAHNAGVVHRDIKPDNILLEHATGRAVVMDFGIARAAESKSRLTQTGIAVGTPAFMSPEQATGDRDVDGRSDVYGLGVVGYLLFTGRLPFESSSTPGMLLEHLSGTPLPLADRRPDLPEALVHAIEKAMARKRGDRWPNAAAFRDALRAAADAPVRAAVASPERADVASAAPQASAAERVPHASSPAHTNGQSHAERRAQPERRPAERLAPPRNAPEAVAVDRVREAQASLRRMQDALHDAREPVARHRDMASEPDADVVARRRIRGFRLQVLQTMLLVAFLFFLNMTVARGFPWVVFPALGLSLSLLGRLHTLSEQGIGFGDVVRGHVEGDLVSGELPSRAQRALGVVKDWKRHLKWVAAGAMTSAAGLLGLAASNGAEVFAIPLVGGLAIAGWNGALTFRDWLRLRDVGLDAREAFGEQWRDKIAAMDDRPRSVRVAQELRRLADPELLRSSHGPSVRDAVDDHTMIRDTWLALTDADRDLVPDVTPTADALLERIVTLGTALSRLEGALDADALPALEARIARAEAERTDSSDDERRLNLLRRQQASITDLVTRRDALGRKLESATLALRTLRLDVVKLRTLGVGAAIADVTSATQEARALSRDIGRAIDAADSLRDT